MKSFRVILASVAILAVILACGQTVKVDPPTFTAYLVPPPTDSVGVEFYAPTPTQTPAPTQTPQVWRARICEDKCQ